MTKQDTKELQDSHRLGQNHGCAITLVKGILYFILAVVALWLVWYLLVDREMKPTHVADVYDEVDASKGEVPDYRALYDSLQEKETFPAEDNGWVDVYRAFGPKSIEQTYTAIQTKWEDFETTKENGAAEVYEKWHKPLCEKFGLDPKEKPLFYDRLEIIPYLVKNGIQGDEILPEDVKEKDGSVSSIYSYWENAEQRPGIISSTEADKEYERLRKTPWTPEESPVAAQWLAENEDRFELVAQAVRKPKFHCWHFIPSPSEGTAVGIQLPDVQFDRELARQFVMRANLRVGTGDISGAIDDIESIVKLGRHLLDDESACLLERLVGLACLGVAQSVQLDGNISRLPTAEERARVVATWRENFGDDALNAQIEAAQKGEFLLSCACFADCLELADNGDYETLSELSGGVRGQKRPVANTTLKLLPINKPKTHAFFRETWRDLMKTPRQERENRLEELLDSVRVTKYFATPRTLALVGLSLLFPAMDAASNAFERSDCHARLLVVAQALWAYYEANGTFPPTFSVDANGTPLHSWRVLILPYLGEEEKALYDQIRLDEPWNSEHNKAFYAQMPNVYRCPSAKDAKEGETVYAVLVSQDGVFDRSGVGKDPKPFLQLTDRDARRQVILAESPTPFCWMTPDVEIDLDQALASFAIEKTGAERAPYAYELFGVKLHSGGCNTLTFGGAASFLSETTLVDERLARSRLLGMPEPEEDDEEAGPTDENDANATEEDRSESLDATQETVSEDEENRREIDSSSVSVPNSNATSNDNVDEPDATSNEETPNPELE
ncbi:MAG: DUF1559 domain-containing protein [Thermoguttaceae bacterium]|nr:DUF1559 domain-containing protein [Thermoguttaceae bacterium]